MDSQRDVIVAHKCFGVARPWHAQRHLCILFVVVGACPIDGEDKVVLPHSIFVEMGASPVGRCIGGVSN